MSVNIQATVSQKSKRMLTTLNNSRWHEPVFLVFIIVTYFHWLEHLIQVYQVYILDIPRSIAGGVLGYFLPELLENETLHFTYNLFWIAGLLLLYPGLSGRAAWWGKVAVILQGLHFFEHVLLQVQWVTGYYLFNSAWPTSIGQQVFMRIELHFWYTFIAFVPTMLAFYYHFYPSIAGADGKDQACRCSHR